MSTIEEEKKRKVKKKKKNTNKKTKPNNNSSITMVSVKPQKTKHKHKTSPLNTAECVWVFFFTTPHHTTGDPAHRCALLFTVGSKKNKEKAKAMQVTRAVTRAAALSSLARTTRQITYKHRFTASVKGLGVSKSATLDQGVWHGDCDAAGLVKLWPVQKLSLKEATRLIAIFDTLTATYPAAALGRARAFMQIGDYASARAALPATTAADGNLHACVLSARVACAVNELVQAADVRTIDKDVKTIDQAALLAETSELFSQLVELRPDDWEVAAAYGEYLHFRRDAGALSSLERAQALSHREATSRRGKSEMYVNGKTSLAALADYVDYKHQTHFSNAELRVLEPLVERVEPSMEALLTERYPSLTAEQLQVLVPLQLSIEVGSLGLVDYIVDDAAVNVRPWASPAALENAALFNQYTGGKVASLQEHNGWTVEEELACIEATAGTEPCIDDVLSVQKRLATTLADNVRDRIRIKLGEARTLVGDNKGAVAVLTDVIQDNAYPRMYDAFIARGNVCVFSAVFLLRARTRNTP